jgi:hypothetical protein
VVDGCNHCQLHPTDAGNFDARLPAAAGIHAAVVFDKELRI